MKPFWFSLYSLVLALWVGGMAIFTFLVTPVVFNSFGRDLAGEIVGRMFPFYFPYLLALSAVALVAFLLARLASRASFVLLVAALLVNGYTVFKLYPHAVEAKKHVTSFERESPGSPARKRFSRLHAVSAVLNLLVLADGVALLLIAPALGRAGRARPAVRPTADSGQRER